MGIPILSEIEKLITEHGSAAVLKERIALVQDKYGALEKSLAECQSAKQKLEAENEAFKLNNAELEKQRRALEEQLMQEREKQLKAESDFVHGLEPPNLDY